MCARAHPDRTLATAVVALLALASFGVLPACGSRESTDEDKTTASETPEAGGGKAAFPGAAQPPEVDPRPPADTVLVTVNGQAIKQADIDEALGRMLGGAAKADPKQLDRYAAQLGPRIEKQLVQRILLNAAAKEKGIAPTDEEIQARFDKLVETRLPENVDVDAFLKKNGLSRETILADLRDQLAHEKLLETLPGAGEPSDADVKAHYDANVLQFQRPEQVRARHILVMVDKDASDADKAKKREGLEALRVKIIGDEGVDFAALAKEHSDCPSKSKGGDLGFFGRGQMVPPFEKAAFGLETGAVSEVIETQFGFHIIKTEDRQEAGTTPFDEVKVQLKARLHKQAKDGAVKAFLTELEDKATIVRADDAPVAATK